MQKFTFLIVFSLLSTALFAQNSSKKLKTKIKKEQIFINDSIVGNWESAGKFLRPHQYYFKNLDNKIILSFEDKRIKCLFNDSSYLYTKITLPELNKVIGIKNERLNADNNIESTILRYMVEEFQLIDKNGKLNQPIVDKFIAENPDTIPNSIKQDFAYQKQMMNDMGFVVPRDNQKAIVVGNTSGCTAAPDGFHLIRCYSVLQDNVQIGRVRVVGKNPKLPGNGTWEDSMRMEFYNSKNARIGVYKSLTFPNLLVYKPNINIDFMDNQFKKFQGDETTLIREISKWFTDKSYW